MAFGGLIISINMLVCFTLLCLSQVNEVEGVELEEVLVVRGNESVKPLV